MAQTYQFLRDLFDPATVGDPSGKAFERKSHHQPRAPRFHGSLGRKMARI